MTQRGWHKPNSKAHQRTLRKCKECGKPLSYNSCRKTDYCNSCFLKVKSRGAVGKCVRCLGCCMVFGLPTYSIFWCKQYVPWIELSEIPFTFCQFFCLDEEGKTVCLIYHERPLYCKHFPSSDRQRRITPKCCPYRKVEKK